MNVWSIYNEFLRKNVSIILFTYIWKLIETYSVGCITEKEWLSVKTQPVVEE